jgi:hypothetical protein
MISNPGEHADDFGVRMLRDLTDEGAAIGLGHPVFGLDALLGVNSGLKAAVGCLSGGGAILQAIRGG